MRYGIILVFALIIAFIFRSWFTFAITLSAGDWPYLFLENIKEFSFLPVSGALWLTPYYQMTAKIFVQYLGLNWNIAEKILWFWPFLLISIISSYYLTKSLIGVLIYTTNPYVLMLVGGGQMGVAFAYSIAPFVLVAFIKFIDNLVFLTLNLKFKIQNLKFSIVAGLVLGIQMMFDPRVAYVTMLGVVIYLLVHFFSSRKIILTNAFLLLIPVVLALALNSFWIVSVFKYGFPKGFEGYSSLLGFQFLSFADFSHALSLLHPNWPENIFGKIYFMQPEFMLLPILAYSSLLFLKNRTQSNTEQRRIIFFALLGLIGAFLVKGTNPPFGGVNEFLFQYFPGMNMFRDPSKFYILIALSYSILIPSSLRKISEEIGVRLKLHNTYYIIPTTFLVFWLILIRPAIAGQLNGTFKPNSIPNEYIVLKDFLNNQPIFFKTLWLPNVQRFGFRSEVHPAVEGSDYFNVSPAEVAQKLNNPENLKSFKKSQIKYVIVPYDSQKELFIIDRKYSEKQRSNIVEELRKTPFLREIPSIGRIIIFEVSS